MTDICVTAVRAGVRLPLSPRAGHNWLPAVAHPRRAVRAGHGRQGLGPRRRPQLSSCWPLNSPRLTHRRGVPPATWRRPGASTCGGPRPASGRTAGQILVVGTVDRVDVLRVRLEATTVVREAGRSRCPEDGRWTPAVRWLSTTSRSSRTPGRRSPTRSSTTSAGTRQHPRASWHPRSVSVPLPGPADDQAHPASPWP